MEIQVPAAASQPAVDLFRVADNGKGLPEGFDTRKANALGLKLVHNLVRQLGGAVEVRSGNGLGTEFIIRFERGN